MATMIATRYRAKALTETIDAQGRRRDWVATQAGIDAPLLSHLEKGRRTVTAEVAQRIASALQTPFFVLFESADADDMDARRVVA